MSAGCSGCATTWTAATAAHCTLCHETFTTVGNFDRHRHPPKRLKVPMHGECAKPLLVGLVQDARGFWHMPGPEREWAS